MKVEELKALLSNYEDNADVYIRYGSNGQVSDIEAEFVCDDNGLGEFYLLCSNGQNIQDTGMDG